MVQGIARSLGVVTVATSLCGASSRCRAVWYTAVQCRAVLHTAVQCSAVRHTAAQCNVVQCSDVMRNAMQCCASARLSLITSTSPDCFIPEKSLWPVASDRVPGPAALAAPPGRALWPPGLHPPSLWQTPPAPCASSSAAEHSPRTSHLQQFSSSVSNWPLSTHQKASLRRGS